MSVLARLVAWLPEPESDFGETLAAIRPTAPGLARQLAACRGELLASERRRATLKDQLDHYIGQAIQARAERDSAEAERVRLEGEIWTLTQFGEPAVLKAAIVHLQDLLAQALADKRDLERAVLALEASQENLTAIAEGLRDELRELRAGLTVGALRKGAR